MLFARPRLAGSLFLRTVLFFSAGEEGQELRLRGGVKFPEQLRHMVAHGAGGNIHDGPDILVGAALGEEAQYELLPVCERRIGGELFQREKLLEVFIIDPPCCLGEARFFFHEGPRIGYVDMTEPEPALFCAEKKASPLDLREKDAALRVGAERHFAEDEDDVIGDGLGDVAPFSHINQRDVRFVPLEGKSSDRLFHGREEFSRRRSDPARAGRRNEAEHLLGVEGFLIEAPEKGFRLADSFLVPGMGYLFTHSKYTQGNLQTQKECKCDRIIIQSLTFGNSGGREKSSNFH